MGELVNRGESAIVPEVFYKQVSSILNAARDKAYTAVNYAMVEAYWEIGKSIVDEPVSYTHLTLPTNSLV